MPAIEVGSGALVILVGILIFLDRFTVFNAYFGFGADAVTGGEEFTSVLKAKGIVPGLLKRALSTYICASELIKASNQPCSGHVCAYRRGCCAGGSAHRSRGGRAGKCCA